MIAFTKVKLPYGWLSNMSPHPIEYGGYTWRTTEALFQALRFPVGDPVREEIRIQKSPMGAKMVAKKYGTGKMMISPRSELDLDNMRYCLARKIACHPQLEKELMATGDEQLVEDVTRRPSGVFWGMALGLDGWYGENWLGKLWMELREKLKALRPADPEHHS